MQRCRKEKKKKEKRKEKAVPNRPRMWAVPPGGFSIPGSSMNQPYDYLSDAMMQGAVLGTGFMPVLAS